MKNKIERRQAIYNKKVFRLSISQFKGSHDIETILKVITLEGKERNGEC